MPMIASSSSVSIKDVMKYPLIVRTIRAIGLVNSKIEQAEAVLVPKRSGFFAWYLEKKPSDGRSGCFNIQNAQSRMQIKQMRPTESKCKEVSSFTKLQTISMLGMQMIKKE